MNGFSRRAFLKCVLSLAASAAVPVELIEKATSAISLLPDKPTKEPAGYFKINDLIVPVTWMEISHPMGDIITGYGSYGYVVSPPGLDTIVFSTNHRLRFDRERVTFSISNKHLPFEITGNGYFSSCSVDCTKSDEPREYTYSMSCEIDQYETIGSKQ